jgi:hypothetical protein
MEKNEKKTDVLLSLLQDVQENIRFIDSKVGVVIILLTGIVVLFISDVENFITYFDKYSFLLKSLFFLSLGGIVISIYFIAKIILPVNNPVDKIPEPYKSYPNIYQGKNKTFDTNLIVNKFDEGLTSDENINKVLELEYLKTSFIRNVKTKNFNRLIIVCIFALALVVSQYTIMKIEEKNNAIVVEKCCNK